MTEKQFLKFLIAFDDDKLKEFFRSGPLPENNNEKDLKEIVGDEFMDHFVNYDDLFILYTIDWDNK
jgi:hypothetical protein